MARIPRYILDEIINHWNNKEDLCTKCNQYWLKLTTSQRKDIRHDYEFEQE